MKYDEIEPISLFIRIDSNAWQDRYLGRKKGMGWLHCMEGYGTDVKSVACYGVIFFLVSIHDYFSISKFQSQCIERIKYISLN